MMNLLFECLANLKLTFKIWRTGNHAFLPCIDTCEQLSKRLFSAVEEKLFSVNIATSLRVRSLLSWSQVNLKRRAQIDSFSTLRKWFVLFLM